MSLTLTITSNNNVIYINNKSCHLFLLVLDEENVISLTLLIPILEHGTIESFKPCSRRLFKLM